ncbi:ATPase, T2SS/T4P/T4SS family [Neisseria sp. 83E34]|uniref:ATPase, T2SS/T4P/T4SS family n=1 Tax=Neisseria sp. 83E34 TaxID=1692264 RepID=UPI0006CE9F8F|nr:ATPase, T2SS/T4P/T4SS family [Neisseria sp. 83E34]KPN72616.1 secretion system protein E [Neisseria sp. 83E34]
MYTEIGSSVGAIRSDATVRNMLDKLGISALLNRPGVTEVLINRPGELFLETSAGFERIEDDKLTLTALTQLASALCIFNSKHLCYETPIHSVTLPDGERGHIMMPPSCEDKTLVFAFRKPSNTRFALGDYINSGRLDTFNDVSVYGTTERVKPSAIEIDSRGVRDVSDKMKLPHDVVLTDWQYRMLAHKADGNLNDFFQMAIDHRLNICMVGGTGSGKTTFTKALVDMIPTEQRLITIEDTHELSTPNHPNHAHLFYKEHITAKMIVAACMRLKPDRILLTELRGDEAWDYLSVLNTGHPGGMTSVHANDARSVHYRIAQLAKESATGQSMDYDYILNTVRSTIDVICYFEKTRLKELYFDPVEKFYAMSGRS